MKYLSVITTLFFALNSHAECKNTGSSFSRKSSCRIQEYSVNNPDSTISNNDYYIDRTPYRWNQTSRELDLRRRAQIYELDQSPFARAEDRSYAPGQTPRAPFWER